MIPKIIHYCWLSNDPYPKQIETYINTWKTVLCDYQIMLWDLRQFDLGSSIWVKQAYEARKYAFAADYIRLFALYNYGGIYLDSDVEVLKPFDAYLDTDLLVGREQSGFVEMAVLGSAKGNPMLRDLLFKYERPFINKDNTYETRPMPLCFDDFCKKNGYSLITGVESNRIGNKTINVFPADYFSPKSWNSTKETVITENTICIHQFGGSWLTKWDKIRMWYRRLKQSGFSVF